MQKNDYPVEVKREAVRLVIEARMAVKDVSEKLGVHVGPVYVWVKRYREARARSLAFHELQWTQWDDVDESNATVELAIDIINTRHSG